MSNNDWKLARPSKALTRLLLAAIVLVAFALRIYQLDRIPPGPFGDEAIVAILSSEIATGRSFPIFVTAYTGNEVLFFYLAAIVMRIAGLTLFATRLTSALIGTLTVILAYVLAREWFKDEPVIESEWLGLFAATLMATSFWHVSVSRYGFRAITLPLVQVLMLLALWRGLRQYSRKWLIAAGIFCGLLAYTYLSSRVAPIGLAIVMLMVLVAERYRWRTRLIQLAVFGIFALVVFAPLGIFFATHPSTFSTRTEQLSIFSEGGSWQALLTRNTLRALQVFTVRGDPQLRFNLPSTPMFEGPLALLFYGGLGVIIIRSMRPSGWLGRVRYGVIVIWPLLMLIPSILSQPFEVPHSLRSMGVMPFAFFVPALGMLAGLSLLQRICPATYRRWLTRLTTFVLVIVLGATTIVTSQNYFARWATQPNLYYENYADIADMARALDKLPDDGRTIYASAPDYRYPSVALLAHNYAKIKWMQGGDVFVFSPGPATYAWPHATLPDAFWFERFFPPQSQVARKVGPDGAPAYVLHTFDHAPAISPSHPLSVTFGGVIQAIGYDVLRDRPSGGKTDVAMYWRILRKADRGDYSEFITLTDAWGIQWGQGGSFAYPSEQWEPGEVIAERVRVQTDDGTPPASDYALNIGWWSSSTGQRLTAADGQGRFAGTTIAAGPVTVTRRIRLLDVNAVNITHRLPAGKDFGGLKLLGYDQWPASVRQSEVEFVTLHWQAHSIPLPDRQVTLQLRAADQRVVVLSQGGPVHGLYPTSKWDQDEFVSDRLALRIPPDTPAGSYTLEMQVDDLPVQPLGRFDVQAITRNWSPLVLSNPMSATLGSQIALIGYSLEPGTITAGEPLTLTLGWKSLVATNADYTVFVHLVDASSAVRAQKDNAPVNGTYPTFLWLPGEYVSDVYTLSLSPDLPPGDYALEVGMYLPDTGARLAMADGRDKVVLGKVSVTR